MKLKDMNLLFKTAMQAVCQNTDPMHPHFKQPWMGMHWDDKTCVMYPVDSPHKHHSVMLAVRHMDVVMDNNWSSIMRSNGWTYLYYEDGYNVMAYTGARAALRKQQENPVLQR